MPDRPSRCKAIVCGLALAWIAACSPAHSTSGDKAGGADAPVELRLALSDPPGNALVEEFARRVETVSHGRLRVRITYFAFGTATPDVEIRLVRAVQAGQYDLGWVATRVWDEVGVQTLTPLQAPFLITDYPLLGRIVNDPIADQMLTGLKAAQVTGVALVPNQLRYAVGAGGFLLSAADWRGARIRVQPSQTTDAIIRSLGATPVHISNDEIYKAIAAGSITGTVSGFPAAQPGYLTANALFPRVDTIFANPRVLRRLGGGRVAALTAAAHATVSQAVANPPDAAALAAAFCTGGGEVAMASDADVAGLLKATSPVTTALSQDPVTRAYVARISALKAEARTASPPLPACFAPSPSKGSVAPAISPSALNGTYRWVLTQAEADRAGPPATDPGNVYPFVVTCELRDGAWRTPGGDPKDFGTYTATRDRIVFTWTRVNTIITMTYIRHANGTLDMTPVLPMNIGDQFVWAGAPWRRIGPPVGAS